MEYKVLLTVFAAVFVAELGDKQVSKLIVFAGASLALVLASAIGVLAGSAISHYVSEKTLNYVAGTGFVVSGVWTLLRA